LQTLKFSALQKFESTLGVMQPKARESGVLDHFSINPYYFVMTMH